MKHLLSAFAIAISVVMGGHLLAQESFNLTSPAPMSGYDSLKLSQLPPLQFPKDHSLRSIPAIVDNSLLPYFRPIFCQDGYECGQAASIGYVFTYEINCLRNLPANIPENQYATYFAYDFVNSGSEYTGVSYYETYEILKQAGCPSVSDYGGMSFGGFSRWMSGYDLYYNSMHNRVSDVYSVKVNTIEGIQTLKNWIYDHGNGSSAGGLGCFYSEVNVDPFVFPDGVPEAGKHVITRWGNSPTHAMTIVGYNDSIRWDYNNDGVYTNDIDLNNDGIIDVRDWEIGGFKMANSYGDTYYGDAGFVYMMYKSVADDYGYDGIWNNTVVVIDVKEIHLPQLTAKVNITYGCRNKLRIMAGVASDPTATVPEYIQHFPIFEYQGGCHPMQGMEKSDTLELGLDLNLLLNYIEPGQQARFFLLVQEDDPSSSNEGTINSFSIIDYTDGINEINSNITALSLNDSVRIVPVNASISYNPVQVVMDTLPEITLYNDFSVPLQAQGGTAPYRWQIAHDYIMKDSTSTMPMVDSVKLQLSSTFNGRTRVGLPFSFPFYGKEYQEVYVTVDGYLMFQNSEIPWPYYIEGRTYFIETPMIAPALCSPFVICESTQGVWYEESENYVVFRWQVQVYGSATSIFNATAKLSSNGRIDINYGSCILPLWVERYAGISNGDGENYKILTYDANFSPSTDQLISFTPANLCSGISLSTDGVLSGNCTRPFTNNPIKICAIDQNNIRDYKTLDLTTTGLQMEYQIVSGNDNKIEFGEEAHINLMVTNYNNYFVDTTVFNLNSNDPYFSLIDSVAKMNGLVPGANTIIEDAFILSTNDDIPNVHQTEFMINALSSNSEWHRNLNVTGYRPVIRIHSALYSDSNDNIPSPGETFQFRLSIINSGGARLYNGNTVITSTDPYLSISNGNASFDMLTPFEEREMTFEMTLSPSTPIGHIIEINLNVTGNNNFTYTELIPLRAGIVFENFESVDLTRLGWQTGADHPWYIEEGSSYEGDYCIRSAPINYDQSSWLKLYWNSASNDSVSFWLNVNSEYWDFLTFVTNDGVQGRWSGKTGWIRAAVSVPVGENIFKWIYKKNTYEPFGEDCARLDYIVFPPLNGTISAEQLPINTTKLSLYPNPYNDQITIAYNITEAGPVYIRITDMKGRILFTNDEVLTLAGDHILKPDLGKLKPGVYTVTLRTDKGVVARKMSKL